MGQPKGKEIYFKDSIEIQLPQELTFWKKTLLVL